MSDGFLELTGKRREDFAGKGHFHFFEDKIKGEHHNGIENLRDSFAKVLSTRKPHEIAAQRFDMPGPGGASVERYWRPYGFLLLPRKTSSDCRYITPGTKLVCRYRRLTSWHNCLSAANYLNINTMKKTRFLFALAICFGIAFGTPTAGSAQDNNPATAQADDDEDDDDADYGWIGLIGLAGLLGLRKKDRDDRDDRVRTGNTTVR